MDEVKGMKVEVSGAEVLSIPRQQLTMSGSEEVHSDTVGTKLIPGEKYHVRVLLAIPIILSTGSVSASLTSSTSLDNTNRRTVFNQHVRLGE